MHTVHGQNSLHEEQLLSGATSIGGLFSPSDSMAQERAFAVSFVGKSFPITNPSFKQVDATHWVSVVRAVDLQLLLGQP